VVISVFVVLLVGLGQRWQQLVLLIIFTIRLRRLGQQRFLLLKALPRSIILLWLVVAAVVVVMRVVVAAVARWKETLT
jgi:hypothetical protein